MQTCFKMQREIGRQRPPIYANHKLKFCRWGVALSTRSGPEYVTYPMGRETVLSNITLEAGQWPKWNQISGEMSGWELPGVEVNVPGNGYVRPITFSRHFFLIVC